LQINTPFKLFGTDEVGASGVSSQDEKRITATQMVKSVCIVFIDISLVAKKYP
jgi:hypothetical protein